MLPRRVSTLPTAAALRRAAPPLRPPALASVACGRRRALSAAPAAAASLQQLHDGILQGFAGFQFPSNDRFAELASRATTAEEAQLVVSAHRQFVDYQRIIPPAHIDALVDACCRAGDWELLVAMLRDSRKLQLFFRGTAPVKRAFDALAGGEAWEELEAAHAALPVMALDWVDSTSQLHSAAIAQLADGGELAAAARALDRALGMAAASPSKHRVRPGIFVKLAEAQLADGDALAAAATLAGARDAWAMDVRMAEAAATAGGGHHQGAAAQANAARAMPQLLVTAVRAAGLSTPAEEDAAAAAADNDDAAAGDDDAAAPPDAAAEAEAEAEAASSVDALEPATVACELLSLADASAREAARAKLTEVGFDVASLPDAVQQALAA